MKGILKKMAGLLLAAGLSIGCAGTALARPDWPSDMGIMAEGGIVMDFNSGAVIFGQNIHQASPPASITKLLTALVVAVFLAVPYWKGRYFTKPVRKEGAPHA